MPFSLFCFSNIAAIFQDDNKYIINKSCGHKVALILTIGRKSQLPQENIEWGRKIWPCKSDAKSFGGEWDLTRHNKNIDMKYSVHEDCLISKLPVVISNHLATQHISP